MARVGLPIPAGAGLGSSGSFTTALLGALHAHTKGIIHPRDLDAIRSWIRVLEPLTGYLILAERLFAEPKAFSEAWNFGPAVRRDAVYNLGNFLRTLATPGR
jgi:hypothetical protein